MTLVGLAVSDGVAIIRLDNPPLNLFNRALTQQVGEILAEIETNESVRCVVVAGAGVRAFSAGSDIKEFPTLMERGTVVEDKLSFENAVFDRLAQLPQPTIAAIEGLALGGGAEFALCCDYRIMSQSGKIGFPEIHLGTVPGSGGLRRLAQLINPSIALALFLDGTPISAERAVTIGLVNDVAKPGRCIELAVAKAHEWAARSAVAVRSIKQSLNRLKVEGAAAELAFSLEASRSIWSTPEMRAGVAAFLEKRVQHLGRR